MVPSLPKRDEVRVPATGKREISNGLCREEPCFNGRISSPFRVDATNQADRAVAPEAQLVIDLHEAGAGYGDTEAKPNLGSLAADVVHAQQWNNDHEQADDGAEWKPHEAQDHEDAADDDGASCSSSPDA